LSARRALRRVAGRKLVAPDRFGENRAAVPETAMKVRAMVRIRILAAAVAATLVPSLALAQASAPQSREEGKPAAVGVERPTTGTPGKGSTTTRAERKAATLEARKKHELAPAGATQNADVAMQKQKSSKTRAQGKAEVTEARKKGELVPAGGAGPAPSK
jgi:hypothetical protein